MSQYLSAHFVSMFIAIFFFLSTGHRTQVLVHAKHTFYYQASPLALRILIGLPWTLGEKRELYVHSVKACSRKTERRCALMKLSLLVAAETGKGTNLIAGWRGALRMSPSVHVSIPHPCIPQWGIRNQSQNVENKDWRPADQWPCSAAYTQTISS